MPVKHSRDVVDFCAAFDAAKRLHRDHGLMSTMVVKPNELTEIGKLFGPVVGGQDFVSAFSQQGSALVFGCVTLHLEGGGSNPIGRTGVPRPADSILGDWKVLTTFGNAHGRRPYFEWGKISIKENVEGFLAVSVFDGSNRASFAVDQHAQGRFTQKSAVTQTTGVPLEKVHSQVLDALMAATSWEIVNGSLLFLLGDICVLAAARE